MTLLPRRHTAWPTDRGWPAILDQPVRRAPVRDKRPGPWLLLFGAASGAVWAGLLALIMGWRWWMIVPIIIGALAALIFENS